jgi:hypothetical protein
MENVSLPRLVPNPCVSWEQHQRFTHRDLAELSGPHLWAEQTTLTAALASRLTRRARPRIVSAWPVIVTDTEWMRVRLHLLHAERQRRRR